MQIVYDGHIFRWQRTGGVSRVFREVISRLPASWSPTLLATNPGQDGLPHHPRLSVSPLPRLRPRRFSQPVKRQWWRARFLREAAVFHPTYYTLASGFDYTDIPCPVVVSANDFISALHPALEINSTDLVRQQLAAIQQAAHVICISRATERDLLHFVPQMAGKTSVVYLGSSFPVTREPPPENLFSPPTFLFVGRRQTYKNFHLLIRAFARACREDPRIRLHTAGPPLDEEELWQLHFAGIRDRVDSTVFPSDDALRELYRRSVALLYPSRNEGFGIPPLEAMACGTVVVASNATCLPEVIGSAGILLDPADEEAWAEQILEVARDRIDRAALIARGFDRASQLNWDACAAGHAAVYQRVLSPAREAALGAPVATRA